MFPPREIALNVAMHSATVRSAARRRHNTGVLTDPAEGRRTFERFMHNVPVALQGARVLELGPGQGVRLAEAAIEQGASYSAFDVAPYLDAEKARGLGIDYRVDEKGILPWPSGSFDIVWSHSVLEHVRHPDRLLRQVRKVLRPEGYHVAEIDLESHMGGRKDPERMYEFLKYPPWLWRLMTSHRSTFVNRLRLSDWRQVFEEAGFGILDEQPNEAPCGLAALQAVPYLSGLSEEDLLTRSVTITSRTGSTSHE